MLEGSSKAFQGSLWLLPEEGKLVSDGLVSGDDVVKCVYEDVVGGGRGWEVPRKTLPYPHETGNVLVRMVEDWGRSYLESTGA